MYMKKLPTLFALALSVNPLSAAAVSVAFSGGGGTPLSISITTPITWTVTDAADFNSGIVFGIGIDLGQVPATIAYGGATTGGGSPASWSSDRPGWTVNNYISSTLFSNNITAGGLPGALIWYSPQASGAVPVVNGDTVTFAGGVLQTNQNINETFTDGAYETYLIAGTDGTLISSAGVAVPEPSSALLLGLSGLFLIRRRR